MNKTGQELDKLTMEKFKISMAEVQEDSIYYLSSGMDVSVTWIDADGYPQSRLITYEEFEALWEQARG